MPKGPKTSTKRDEEGLWPAGDGMDGPSSPLKVRPFCSSLVGNGDKFFQMITFCKSSIAIGGGS